MGEKLSKSSRWKILFADMDYLATVNDMLNNWLNKNSINKICQIIQHCYTVVQISRDNISWARYSDTPAFEGQNLCQNKTS